MEDFAARIADRMSRLSDEELRNVIGKDSREYSPEALEVARRELEKRISAPVAAGAAVSSAALGFATGDPAAGAAVAASGPAKDTKRRRVWGGVLLAVGAFLTYTATLAVSTLIAGSSMGRRPKSEMYAAVVIYLALAAVCFLAGVKRKPKWEAFLGTTFLIMAGLAFVTLASLSSAAASGSALMRRAMLPTALVLLAAGAAIHLLGLAKRRAAE